MNQIHPHLSVIQRLLDDAYEIAKSDSLVEVLEQIKDFDFSDSVDLSNYLKSSFTLGESGDLTRLETALSYIQSRPLEKLENLLEVNRLVCGMDQASFRTTRISEPYFFPDPSVISDGLALLNQVYMDPSLHALPKAAALFQGLLSLHPFTDGNHRTCRLFLDDLLIKNRIPAATVSKHKDLLVANPVGEVVFTADMRFSRFCFQSVKRFKGKSS